jgi:hypothetical protein
LDTKNSKRIFHSFNSYIRTVAQVPPNTPWQALVEIKSPEIAVPAAVVRKEDVAETGWLVDLRHIYIPSYFTSYSKKKEDFAGDKAAAQMRENAFSIRIPPADGSPSEITKAFISSVIEGNFELYRELLTESERAYEPWVKESWRIGRTNFTKVQAWAQPSNKAIIIPGGEGRIKIQVFRYKSDGSQVGSPKYLYLEKENNQWRIDGGFPI